MKTCAISVCVYRVLTFAIVYLVFGLPNLRVGPANFREIRQGMTEQQVEKLLGTPSKVEDVSRYSVMKMVPTRQGARGFRLTKTNSWIGVDRVIVLYFGEKGTVEWSNLFFLEEWAEVNGVESRDVLEGVRYRLITEPLEWIRDWPITERDE